MCCYIMTYSAAHDVITLRLHEAPYCKVIAAPFVGRAAELCMATLVS